MFKTVVQDVKVRRLVKEFELFRRIFCWINFNQKLDFSLRSISRCELDNIVKSSSIVRVRNVCILTGRSRGILSRFRISRIVFRDLVFKKNIPNISKAVW